MNLLFTAALDAGDISVLRNFPTQLLNKFEQEWIDWVKTYEEKYGEVPSVERLRKDYPHFIPLRDERPLPLLDVRDMTLKHKLNEYARSKLNDIKAKMDDGESVPMEEFSKLVEEMNSASVGGDNDLIASPLSDVFEDDEPLEWALEDVFTKGSVNVIYGPAKAGKTWVFMDMALAGALGEDWQGHKTNMGRILYLTEDNTVAEVRSYFRALLSARGVSKDEAKNLPLMIKVAEGYSLATDAGRQKFLRMLEANKIDTVFAETWVMLLSGLDSAQQKDMTPIAKWLRQLTNRGITFNYSHHENKAHDYLGSVVLEGAVNHMLKIEKPKDSNVLKLETDVFRNGDRVKFALRLDIEKDEVTKFAKRATLTQVDRSETLDTPSGKLRKVLLSLKEKPGQTRNEITAMLGIFDKDDAESFRVNSLAKWKSEELGFIEETGIKRGKQMTYVITPKGEALLNGFPPV